MSGEYIFAVKSIGLSKIGGRKPCTLEAAAIHNKRKNFNELKALGRIDSERLNLNYSIAGGNSVQDIVNLAIKLMADVGTSPENMRRDFCQAIEIVFSLPANTTVDLKRFFAECVDWCGTQFGAANVLSADVHMDESAPHCHVLLAPIHEDRWVGGALIDRASTRTLRESFKRCVAESYGLQMTDKLTGARKACSTAMVLQAIETNYKQLIAMPIWQPLRQCLERNPAPFAASLGLNLPERCVVKRKTMAEIFTSPGKGPKREPSAGAL